MEGSMSRTYLYPKLSGIQQTNYNSMYICVIIKSTLASNMDWSGLRSPLKKQKLPHFAQAQYLHLNRDVLGI